MKVKRITELQIFNAISASNRKYIIDILSNKDTSTKYLVPKSKIATQLDNIKNRFKYPSKQVVVDYYDSERIVLIFDKNLAIPSFIPAWLTFNSKGQVIAVANLSYYAKEDEAYLDISEKKLFALMQCAAVIYGLYTFENSLLSNSTFIKNAPMIFVKMASRVFDRLFSLNLDPIEADKVSFLLHLFFQVYLMGRPLNDVSKEYAFQACANDTTKASIFGFYDDLDIEEPLESTLSDPAKFFERLKSVEKLAGVNFRVFTETWTKMYGDFTILGIESLQYFLAMVVNCYIQANLSNDSLIIKLVEPYLTKTYSQLFKTFN